MTINDLREEMEIELTWRTDEFRMLKNNIAYIIKDEDKLKYRKSLVVMLYANFIIPQNVKTTFSKSLFS